MSKGSQKPDQTDGRDDKPQVDALAGRVLSVLAARNSRSSAEIETRLVDHLCNASRAFDPEARAGVLAEMRAFGIEDVAIAEVYIPAAARKLGQDWCDDRLSFADVTIGVARLQGMLRDMETEADIAHAAGDAPTVLMIVRRDEYHTLGALIAARHMRRRGVIVRMALGLDDTHIGRMVQETDFDMVMISASGSERLETLRNLIKIMRKGDAATPPIVVGGTVLDRQSDVRTLTDADHVSNDPDEALELCGLTMPIPADGAGGT